MFKYFVCFQALLLFSCTQSPSKRSIASFTSQDKYELFARHNIGAEISENERESATNDLIYIFEKSHYFDFVDSRIHGVPKNNEYGYYWYGHYWTGVHVVKKNNAIYFIHQSNGSDNVGIQSAPYMEGACYAYKLTSNTKYLNITRKLMRGFSSWIKAGDIEGQPSQSILSRSFYPHSMQSTYNNVPVFYNYDLSRPGISNFITEYVRNEHNPYFGDLYLKNNRSIDDIGHILRAIGIVQSCSDHFGPEALSELNEMNQLYSSWAREVIKNNFVIPTYNQNREVEIRKKNLGDFNNYKILSFDPHCSIKQAIELLGGVDNPKRNCHKGITLIEKLIGRKLQNDAAEIMRSEHETSIIFNDLYGRQDISKKLKMGLANRINLDFKVTKNPEKYSNLDLQDIVSELINANNIGVVLTSEEIRFIYSRIHMARLAIDDPKNYSTFNLFDESVKDGMYSYDPPHTGLYFYSLSSLLGSCDSNWQTREIRPLLNCDKLKDFLK